MITFPISNLPVIPIKSYKLLQISFRFLYSIFLCCFKSVILLGALLLFNSGQVFADPVGSVDTNNRQNNSNENSPKANPVNNPYPFTIIDIHVLNDSTDRSIEIGDKLVVRLDSFNNDLTTKKLILFFNKTPVKHFENISYNAANKELYFKLPLNDSTRNFWNDHLSVYKQNHKTVEITCSVEGYPPFGIANNGRTEIKFTTYNYFSLWLFLIIEALIIITLLYCIKKNLLANPVIKNCENLKKLFSEELYQKIASNYDSKKLSYSLGTTQIVFWFIIIISAYLYLFLLTEDMPPFNTTVLTLLGISTATALGNSFMNSNSQINIINSINDFLEKKEIFTGKIKTLSEYIQTPLEPAVLESKKIELIENQTKLKILEGDIDDFGSSLKTQPRKNFLMDLVSDSSGVSFARFQIAAWTLVLGVIFIIKVWNTMNMPEFDATVLTLMGISSGTFLTFKVPETKVKS